MTSPVESAPVAVVERPVGPRTGPAGTPAGTPAETSTATLTRQLAGLAAAATAGVDVGRFVERVAAVLGLPVAVREPDLEVRCWSAPAVFRLDRPPALPAVVLEDPPVSRLGPGCPSTVLPPAPRHGLPRRHLLAAVVVDGEVAGYLDVGELGRPLAPTDPVVVEQAAAMLSLRLAGDVRVERLLARTRDDVVADLLRGTRPVDDLRRFAARAGLDLDVTHVVVRVPTAAGTAPADARTAVHGALAAATTRTAATHLEPDAVVGLVPITAPSEVRALRARLRGELGRIAAATGLRRVVLSGAVDDPGELPAALAATREVDEIVRAFGGSAEIVAVDEFDAVRLVVSADKAGAAVRFAEQNLGPLRRSDESTGGDLVATLRSYLSAGAQVRAAATALGVHENTVRYRLGRIQHLTGLDLRRFDALLVAQLAFQIDGLAGGGSKSPPEAARKDRMVTADGNGTKGNV